MPNSNLDLLTDAARLLKPLLGELVFVGGCATTLLITDTAAADLRPTFDVDAIAEITSYAEYTVFSEKLRTLGFAQDMSEDAPICRCRQAKTTLDVMPLDEKILGFSNRWYKPAMQSAHELTSKTVSVFALLQQCISVRLSSKRFTAEERTIFPLATT